MIGVKISPILVEIENTIWEFEAHNGLKPCYSKECFRAVIKIFMNALMDKIWELHEKESIDIVTRNSMAEKCGKAVRDLVKTYTNIDTHKIYQ